MMKRIFFIFTIILIGCSPNGVYIKVQPGQTLYSIARTYGVKVKEIKNANKVKGNTIYAGQRLFIPNVDEVKFVKPTIGRKIYFRGTHRLKSIAEKYHLPLWYLKRVNKIPARVKYIRNRYLFIPGPSEYFIKKEIIKNYYKNKGKRNYSKKVIHKKKKNRKLSGEWLSIFKKKKEAVRVENPSFKFIWPVKKGRITSTFHSKKRPEHNGIDIAVPVGTPIYAAADGVVIYSDNWLSGYGNMIIIKHKSNFFTIYAHNSKNLVRKGDRVKKGQKIALSGMTGRATGPHLHFEIRYKDIPVNPLKYLPKRQ